VALAALPRVRRVHAQVAAYARQWDEANALTLAGTGPLWVVLGDSTAQGIGAPGYEQGYVGQLRQWLEQRSGTTWRVLNLSKSGAKVADVVEVQLPRLEALDVPPELVTCAIGANDLVARTPADRFDADLHTIMARLPEGSVIATVPQGLRPARAAAINDLIRSQAPAAGLAVADVWAHTGPPWRGKFAADGFHPGALGYADWARAFVEALAQRYS
jgi:acyl-CoA thioesterase I